MVVLDKVTYSYGREIVIKDITIKIEDNKIFGIIGKSGSGKTTLLELIDGLLKPSSGRVFINDIDINKDSSIRKNIGFIFQCPEEQFFESTVKKEIEFAVKNFKIKSEKIIDVLKLVGLNENYLNKPVKNLSNGEKRMVAIASILIYNPSIILFDEPTIGLDYKNKKKLIDLIKKLKKYGKTVIVVSHDIDLLYQISDNLIIINEGRVLLYGDKDSVYNEIKILDKYNIPLPKILLFERLVKENKNIKLMHSTCVNDLIKEVYRNV